MKIRWIWKSRLRFSREIKVYQKRLEHDIKCLEKLIHVAKLIYNLEIEDKIITDREGILHETRKNYKKCIQQ